MSDFQSYGVKVLLNFELGALTSTYLIAVHSSLVTLPYALQDRQAKNVMLLTQQIDQQNFIHLWFLTYIPLEKWHIRAKDFIWFLYACFAKITEVYVFGIWIT